MTSMAARWWRRCAGRQVDALEHEVAQLVHDRQDVVVHAHLAARQGALDDGLDHAPDPGRARAARSGAVMAAGKSSSVSSPARMASSASCVR